MNLVPAYFTLMAFSIIPAYAFDLDEHIRQANQDLWHVGDGMIPGDYFVYDVCHHVRHLGDDQCYQIRLDYIAELLSPVGDVWVVQAEILNDDHTTHHVFLINSETLEITSDGTASDVARSVENTIFYLAEFAHEQSPKSLRIGNVWGTISSPLDAGSEIIVSSLEIAHLKDVDIDVHVIRYGLFESSTFAISSDIPFPVYAHVYDVSYVAPDPPTLFSFELVDYSRLADHFDYKDADFESEHIRYEYSNTSFPISGD